MSKFIFLSFLDVLIFPAILFSQNQEIDFPFKHIEYISEDHGLKGGTVYWAVQDKNGFIWFITDVALNRYDGNSFRSYGYSPDDANSISTDMYYGLVEDKNGTLWIPSSSQGLYSFDPYREKFMNYRHQPASNNSIAKNWITAMDMEGDSIIWMAMPFGGGTEGPGLDKFDLKRNSFTHYPFNDSTRLPRKYVLCLVSDERKKSNDGQGKLWIFNGGPGNNTGIDLFNTRTGKILDHYDFPFTSKLAQHAIKTDAIKTETIWIGSDDNGIYGFNTVTRKFTIIKPGHPCRNAGWHINGHNETNLIGEYVNNYYPVMEDHAGNLWTTNDDNEIVYYDRAAKQFYFQPIQKGKADFGGLPFFFEDRSHRVWVCTGNGLIAIDTKQKNIFVCRHHDNDPKSISGNSIGAIYRAKNGPLFIGNKALESFDKKTKSFSPFTVTDNGKKIRNEGVVIIYEDRRNNIWFTGNLGVLSYNRNTKKGRLYKFYSDDGPVKNDEIFGIVEDRKGRYWIAAYFSGLWSLDPATGKVRIFSNDNSPGSLSTNQVSAPFEDSKGILYMYGLGGGFITFNPDSERFKIYHHDPEDPFSVSHETAIHFRETKNGLIWFGTRGGGINVFNPATGKFKAFTTRDGLVHDNVTSIIEDNKANFWAGTAGGISCFAVPDDPFAPGCKIKFRNYDINDGLPSNSINLGSAFCDNDGTLYFGTTGDGLFYFHPDDLTDNDFIPPVYITEFRLKNKLVGINDTNSVLKSPIEFTKEITLNYKQNIISVSFAALNYTHPEKNKYAYQLEGIDEDWIYTDASKRFAYYTNLEPGSYTFKVKGSNNDGVWNETPTQLRIVITPPFWQTIWFRILAGLFVLAMVYAFYRYRIGQILLLQRIRNKIAADLHDDIGSTLNSISIFSEVARKDEGKRDYSLKMIGENSRKIIDTMSDIVWSINPENDSFDKIIFRMCSLSYNLMKAKKIECTFSSDDSLNSIKLSIDKRRNFYLIFKEALNNLVKYSKAARASVLVSHEQGSVTCIVRDDGVGFDSSREHSGNGLSNMKKRAEEIGATFVIESAAGKGTSVEFSLKI